MSRSPTSSATPASSASSNPGNSGGALVNWAGQLVGVPTAGAAVPNSGGGSIGLGFAIPVDLAMSVDPHRRAPARGAGQEGGARGGGEGLRRKEPLPRFSPVGYRQIRGSGHYLTCRKR